MLTIQWMLDLLPQRLIKVMLLNRLEMDLELDIKIHSRTPKYRQLIAEINNKIERGVLPYGHKLPSINTLSEGYLLSRNTVEKAYVLLKEDGVIEAVKGKGYFVKNTQPLSKMKIMLLVNNINDYNRFIYETLNQELHSTSELDLHIYRGEFELFKKIIEENCSDYHYYLIMPGFGNDQQHELREILSLIPRERLIILNKKIEKFDRYLGLVYQDFKMDFYDVMVANIELAQKYSKFIIFVPDDPSEPYPFQILDGFRRFCTFNGFDFDVIKGMSHHIHLNKGEAAITISDKDLILILKEVRRLKLNLGSDFGILSYNESPLKEELGNGISVITTDFVGMAKRVAQIVCENAGGEIKNNFQFIRRGSF